MTSASTWTIESELRAMAGDAATIGLALERLGLATGSDVPEVNIIEPWRRGGAETYVCAFVVASSTKRTKYLLKAFVPYPGTLSVAHALARYISRAETLRQAGVRTPHTYAWLKGTLLQEYVPDDLPTALRSETAGRRQALVASAIHQRIATERVGFVPLQFFSDLRADQDETVLVDLGQDLLPCDRVDYDSASVLDDWKGWLRTNSLSEPIRIESLDIARSILTT